MRATTLLVCLVAVFGYSSGLKCYTCSWWSKNCDDPFVKHDSILEECNTRTINDFNKGLGNAVNTANNALQNFANQVGFNFNNQNSNNNFNLPNINEDSVGCAKIVLKSGENRVRVARGCVYHKADLCRSMQRIDDEIKTLKFCDTCDGDYCNGAESVQSPSTVAMIFTTAATCLFYGLR
ncbi:uncharacterized protein LOC126842940 [Adelges cooleyi]|uniref:uncharacterized protein LOC126842940 n=1 Tax=Adelges cooleyi TaxID=133065 RepID=UPI00218038A6|nr:uncharacterized protein LOC126842940 [Adelges cooleyi]